MSKLGLFRAALRSSFSVRTVGATHNHGVPCFLNQSPKHFSTESEPQQTQDEAVDSFIRTPATGSVYARLYGGVTRNTLKTDIIHLLEGCNLSVEDVKVDYNRFYNPSAVLVHFSSSQAYDQAMRMINKKGRLYKMEKVPQSQWDLLAPYYGKTVVLQGVPRTAVPQDVERFLSGLEYDASSIQLFFRAGIPGKMATVRFPSQIQAMNCFLSKNKSFCLNDQVLVRVLQ